MDGKPEEVVVEKHGGALERTTLAWMDVVAEPLESTEEAKAEITNSHGHSAVITVILGLLVLGLLAGGVVFFYLKDDKSSGMPGNTEIEASSKIPSLDNELRIAVASIEMVRENAWQGNNKKLAGVYDVFAAPLIKYQQLLAEPSSNNSSALKSTNAFLRDNIPDMKKRLQEAGKLAASSKKKFILDDFNNVSTRFGTFVNTFEQYMLWLDEENSLIVADNINPEGEQTLAVKNDMLAKLKSMDPFKFERLVGDLLIAMGLGQVDVTPGSNDAGVDVRGVLSFAEKVKVPVAVQVKRYAKNVDRPAIQNLRGSLQEDEIGFFITTSDFSEGAKNEAVRQGGGRRIDLFNGNQVVDLILKYGIGPDRLDLDTYLRKEKAVPPVSSGMSGECVGRVANSGDTEFKCPNRRAI